MFLETDQLIAAPIQPSCRVSIAIPARDEAEYLVETLAAFARQIDLRGNTLPAELFEIILLINNSSDDSAAIARQFQRENPQLNLHVAELDTAPENANSGYVRRLLMNEAYCRQTASNQTDGVILTTDGDTRVADDWIAANLFEIERGADAVGGRILFTAEELARINPAAREFHLLDEKYRLLAAALEAILDALPHDDAPRHHQHFNASFAVTTEAFKKAGGIPAVRFLEDVAFFDSLMRVDAKFRNSPLVKVFTSARCAGRTEAGLSTQISDWINLSGRGENFLVESAAAIEKRARAQNKLRCIWVNQRENKSPKVSEIESLAAEFFVASEVLFEQINRRGTFGSLLENVHRMQFENKIWSERNPLVPVEAAVFELRKLLENLRPETFGKTAAA